MNVLSNAANFCTIIGTVIGCFMFYFTLKNHQWLVEDRKKQIEEEMRRKICLIFSYVAQCYQQRVNEKVPKEIVKFIKSDIDNELSGLERQKKVQIENAQRENDFQRENYIQSNINNFNSARSVAETYKQYDDEFNFQRQQIEQNFIAEQQKVLKEIISQYRNGTRLNDIDFNKLRSYFKDNKQIEECYKLIMKNC